ncbi:MAG: aminodeoxychorismate synthase component I [Saprospiraceae bacterium]|nr:aminodeoxychorismate synthase component I [Saprospiraceae bacterium]
MIQPDAIRKMNRLGGSGTPFFFALDFEGREALVCTAEELADQPVLFQINGYAACEADHSGTALPPLQFEPIPYSEYRKGFDTVLAHLQAGNSYLVNLTFPTAISTPLSLEDIYYHSRAPYKLLWRERFVVFSPETFVRIREGRIATFPMKGTIDASLPDAEAHILADGKELAEHVTIVDLLRNDLSRVAEGVRVDRFRYIDRIRTNRKTLLQVSSEISGQLPPDYRSRIGDLLDSMLPAGSVSGAPKAKTLDIIREAEGAPRGFYTGIFGRFDGNDLDSAVMIRFIEQRAGGLFFRSGGGITAQSDPHKEYQELIDKVYVPLD